MPGQFLNDLAASFAAHAARPALIYRGHTWTYDELDAAVRRCAGWLRSMGVVAGDRVVLFTGQKLPFLIGHLGAMYTGGIPLPLNPRFTRDEMRYFLIDSGARVVIVGSDQQPLVAELAAQMQPPPSVIPDAVVLNPPSATWHE